MHQRSGAACGGSGVQHDLGRDIRHTKHRAARARFATRTIALSASTCGPKAPYGTLSLDLRHRLLMLQRPEATSVMAWSVRRRKTK